MFVGYREIHFVILDLHEFWDRQRCIEKLVVGLIDDYDAPYFLAQILLHPADVLSASDRRPRVRCAPARSGSTGPTPSEVYLPQLSATHEEEATSSINCCYFRLALLRVAFLLVPREV